MGSLLTFLIVLSLLVLVHELGHFLAARWFGMRVEEFGFGFPPRAFGMQRGETVYSINWIPLGGFVKIKGESGDDARDPDSFSHKPAWQRAVVLAAGVLMNVVLAWTLFTVGYAIGMPQIAEDLPQSARVREAKVQVLHVVPESPAARAGLKEGDEVLTMDGKAIAGSEDARAVTGAKEGQEVRIAYRRGTESLEVGVVPSFSAEAGRPSIGVALVRTGLVSYPLHIAPLHGLSATWMYGTEIITTFGSVVMDLFRAQKPSVEFSGPVGIAVLTSEVAQLGFLYLVQFTAILSVNLAVINILPIPALDGGRLAFLAAERLRGRAFRKNLEATVHSIGFALLMALVVFVTYRDLVKFGGRIAAGFTGMF